MTPRPVSIVGAGLAGALLALFLARRGFAVALYEKRPDPRQAQPDAGRSINLALAARGIRALERAGVMERVRPFALPMRSRCIHERSGETQMQPYGQRPHEINYSVGRAALNRVLIEETARHANVALRFEQSCIAARPASGTLRLRDARSGDEYDAALSPMVAADGAGSAVRRSLEDAGHLTVREALLDHDYKELTIPAIDGMHALDPEALHIWPRGGYMLIALPNPDASFTATLFLPKRGSVSFETLRDAAAARRFFEREFPDAIALMPAFAAEFAAHPQGELGTIYASSWHVRGEVLLLGDAAHAIVPFHGQGMNAAFEDCVLFDELLDQLDDWAALFAEFERVRRPDAEAIAAMALENYVEMRATVLDAKFQRQKLLALELERRHPDRFIPRYSMVMFHPEIGYAAAQRRGLVQAQILDELDAGARGGIADFDAAATLIEQRLPPLRR
ncbi:MAG: FAD-dependent oxidoreductase [Gammaproteobacteria bacterium]